jgi:hypothetical protein
MGHPAAEIWHSGGGFGAGVFAVRGGMQRVWVCEIPPLTKNVKDGAPGTTKFSWVVRGTDPRQGIMYL